MMSMAGREKKQFSMLILAVSSTQVIIIRSGGGNSDTHSPKDDSEKIDYEFFRKSTSFIYEVIMDLANRSTGS
jgi:hypothetical protein